MTNFELARELRFAEDQDLAEILVMFKRMCDNDDNYDDTTEKDYQLKAEDMRGFDANATGKWIGEWMDEVIHSEEIETSAWWKQPTPKEKFDKMPELFKQNSLMESAMRCQELLEDLRRNGTIDTTDMDSFSVWQTICDLSREFEYTYYDTDEYSADYLDISDTFFTKRLKEELT